MRRRPNSSQKRRSLDLTAIEVATKADVPALAQLMKQATPMLTHAAQAMNVVLPFYVKAFNVMYTAYMTMPVDVFHTLVGLGMCFFGGAYCASIAAIEAFAMVGWSTTRAALEEIYEDVRLIAAAHDADEQRKKTDGEPKPGALLQEAKEQPVELLQRKVCMAAMAVRDPEKLTTAVAGVYAGWIAVQGTLRLEFAKTVTLGVSIAQMLDGPALRFGLPVLAHVVPPEYHRWLPTLIRTAAKAMTVSIAWYLSITVATFQSALRGGQLCAKGVLRWARKNDLLVGAEEDSYHLDELLGYALTALGFYMQFCNGFAAPFPLNIVMAPFSIVEWWIRWSITT